MAASAERAVVTLFFCGDVMLGRGVDQILAHPGDPALREASWEGSALGYLRLAEERNGPIPRRVPAPYVWGEALAELERRKPHARIANLETAVTTSEDWDPKGINYRMHPRNIGALTAAGLDCCVLANNHVLDFGASGLAETMATLSSAGIRAAGAGLSEEQARRPAILPLPGKGRVLVFALADDSSGAPESWAAAGARPGVWRLSGYGREQAADIGRAVERWKRPGDLAVVSLHWGGNWGYEAEPGQSRLAHALIDEAGADLVYGHSSHHPRGIEVYRGKPVLYGCGDFIDDYEGITGYEEYRAELGFMYFASVDVVSMSLARLELVPTRLARFRVRRPPRDESDWLAERLVQASAPFRISLRRQADGAFLVEA